MAISGQNVFLHKRPVRPIVGGTLDGQRPMLYDYWRTGYGKPEVERLPYWIAIAGEYHCKAGYSTNQHDANERMIQLFYLVGGQGRCRLHGIDRPIHAGDLFIVPKHADYQLWSAQNITYYWLLLDGDWPLSLFPQVGLLPVGYDDEFEQLFIEVRETLILRRGGFTLHSVGLLFALLARLEALMGGGNSAESAYPPLVRDAISVLRESYAASFDAQKVASTVGASPAHLRTLFKHWIGESPLQFHTRYRIEQAQKLLDQHSMAIYEVAHHVGFEDAQYFARVFKKVTGLTPTQYLNR